MRKHLSFLFLLFITIMSVSQNSKVDNLRKALNQTKYPVEGFNLLNKIAERYYTSDGGNIDSASCVQMLRIAQELNNDSLLAIAYNLVGGYFISNRRDYGKYLEFYFKGIPLAEKANDMRRRSSLNADISMVYFKLGI